MDNYGSMKILHMSAVVLSGGDEVRFGAGGGCGARVPV